MNNIILTEAFKELELLEEEAFDINSAEGLEDAKEFMDEVPQEDELEIADVYAEEEEDLADSYIGKVVLECNVCHSKIFEDADAVTVDEETNVANIEEECPYCFSQDGYKVIGQIAPMGQVEEEVAVEEEIPATEEPEELPEEEVEEETEVVEESLKKCPKCGKEPCECKEGLHESVSHVDAHYIIKFDTEEEALAARDKLRDRNFTCDIYPDNYIEVVGDAASDSVKAAILNELGLSESMLEEDFKEASITTDDAHMEMTSDEDGKVTVTTEPVHEEEFEDDFMEEEPGEEMLAPVDDETVAEIKDETEDELIDEEPSEDEVDVDIDEFDEDSFDELGESYLKRVYENVNSFKTTNVKTTNKNLIIEGVIDFSSGAKKKTSFLLEAKDINNKGVVRFIGENKEITRGKKAFTMTGKVKNNKFMCEALRYHYMAKNNNGKSTRVNGTVRISK